MSVELILRGGQVVDGTGAGAVAADVLVSGGRIVDIVTPGTAAEGRVLDVSGLTVAPGFIDIHTHSDLGRISYPDAASRTLQGITTEVIGNCGLTPVPLSPRASALEEFRTIIGPIDTITDLPFTWSNTGEYLDVLDATPGATNLVPLLGHGSIRYSAMELVTDAATDEQRATMQRTLHTALDEGFWGMSLGFMYAPGEVSDQRELHGLIGVLRDHGALLTSHLRAYNHEGLAAAVSEALELAASGDVPLEISHLRSINDDGTAIERAFELLAATEVDVEADAYPYLAGHTTLLQLLPAELRGRGVGEIIALARTQPGSLAEALRSVRAFDASAITIVRAAPGATEVGHSLDELESSSEDWAAVAERLLVAAAGNVDVIVVGTRAEDGARVLRDPLVSIASDGSALSLEHSASVPHPRSIGTFPRAFRELLDAGLPLGEIVRKATSKPAARMGLRDRGILAPGMIADIVAFDARTIADLATYASPLVPPAGIREVIVAGTPVVSDAKPTGQRPGRLLRRNP